MRSSFHLFFLILHSSLALSLSLSLRNDILLHHLIASGLHLPLLSIIPSSSSLFPLYQQWDLAATSCCFCSSSSFSFTPHASSSVKVNKQTHYFCFFLSLILYHPFLSFFSLSLSFSEPNTLLSTSQDLFKKSPFSCHFKYVNWIHQPNTLFQPNTIK